MMRHLDALPRFLLKLPFFVRLSVAILSVVFFLLLYMIVSPAARSPLMLAIPMALVAWMFRKRGVFICLASMVLVLWVYYSLRMKSILLSSSMIISFITATLALVVIGLLVSLLRDSLDVVDDARAIDVGRGHPVCSPGKTSVSDSCHTGLSLAVSTLNP